VTQIREKLEGRGAEQILPQDRSGSARSQAWLWAAANMNPFGIVYGFFIMRFSPSWLWASFMIVVGCLAGYSLLGLVAAAGPKGGRPTMALSRLLFGRAGNFLPGTVSYLALVGWSAVNLILAVLVAVALVGLGWTTPQEQVRYGCFAVVALIVLTVAFFGYRLVIAVQPWIAIAVVATIAGYATLTAHLVDIPERSARPGLAELTGGAVFVLAAGGLAWVTAGADYSRYLPESSPPVGVWAWTVIGGGLPVAMLMLYGVLLCASRPELAASLGRNPMGALVSLVPPWFAAVLLFVTLIGFASNAAINLCSSGLNLLALDAPLRRPVAVLVNGTLVLVAAGYALFESPDFFVTFESFLDILGVPIAAWCAVFLSESARRSDWLLPVSTNQAAKNTAVVALTSLIGFGLSATPED
jgi:purine-cytosine permease-like protein